MQSLFKKFLYSQETYSVRVEQRQNVQIRQNFVLGTIFVYDLCRSFAFRMLFMMISTHSGEPSAFSFGRSQPASVTLLFLVCFLYQAPRITLITAETTSSQCRNLKTHGHSKINLRKRYQQIIACVLKPGPESSNTSTAASWLCDVRQVRSPPRAFLFLICKVVTVIVAIFLENYYEG